MDHSTDDICSFDELLPECKNHILQFLPMQDCLQFTCTSKKSLVASLPQLGQRRRMQFYQRYCYQIDNPTVLQQSDTKWDPSVNEEEADGLFSSRLVHRDHWYIIPSVGERIIQLYRCIPASHPANNDLRDLKAILVDHQNQQSMVESSNFVESFRQLCHCTRAHKLHASLLSKSTVYCNPKRCQRYSNTARARHGNNDNNPNSLSVTLETYMGDVLVAVYLMGNKIANLVEGGPSFDDWNKHILALLRHAATNANNNNNSLAWYKYWVYLHSTLLRTFPFSIHHAKILLGPYLNGILGHSIPQNEHYVHPHYCYMGLAPRQIESTTKIIRTLLLSLANNNDNLDDDNNGHGTTNNTLRMAHQTTMNQFGPLGPAFRGRDEIHTRIMNPFSLLHRLHHPEYALLPTTWFLQEGEQEHVILDSRTFHAWFRGTDVVVRWMLELKEECSKSRPMTVMPPVVTVEPIAISALMMDHAIAGRVL